MSENQIYKLQRTMAISTVVLVLATSFMFLVSVDIVFWQSWFTSWATAENYLPVIYTVAILTLPFWVLAIAADRKLKGAENG